MPIKFKTTIQLNPSELDEHFEEHIIEKLQKQYEGVCSRYGFIKPGSIQIVERSLGQLMKPHFNGHIRFELSVIAEVCNPAEGMIITATVKNKNQLGILAESVLHMEGGKKYPVLDIIIPKKTAGISSEIGLENLDVGDNIYVEILGKRYQLNDKKISIIGRGVSSNKPTKRVQYEPVGEDDIEEEPPENDADEDELDETSELSEEEVGSEDEAEPMKKADIPFIEEENPFATDEEDDEDIEDEFEEDDEEDADSAIDYGDDA